MKPEKNINVLDVVFGTNAIKLMPAYKNIPQEYKGGRTKWNNLFNDWFFDGLSSLELTPKDGVNKTEAIAHIRTIMSSFEPQHGHKEAAVAYLLSQWFVDAKWTKAKAKSK